MHVLTNLQLLILAVIGFSGCAFAAYDGTCSLDSDCTADNAMCEIKTGCSKGTCSTCLTDYVAYMSGASTSCLKNYGTSCTGANAGNCGYDNAACDNSVCGCATDFTWDATYLACVENTKAWGDTCSGDVNNCHTTTNAVCTAAGVCDCDDGYKKSTGYTCRSAYLGESCTASSCGVKGVSATSGEVAPTCQNDICACDTGDQEVSYEGTSYCTDVATPNPLIETSLACTAHHVCKSGICRQCPDTATGSICVDEANSGRGSSVTPLLVMVTSVIAGLLRI